MAGVAAAALEPKPEPSELAQRFFCGILNLVAELRGSLVEEFYIRVPQKRSTFSVMVGLYTPGKVKGYHSGTK